MTKIRLLPVVVLAIAALLVLKTLGLVTNGGYVLTGMGAAQAAGASSGGVAGSTETDSTITPAGEPTIEDTNPTLSDTAPTLGGEPAAGGHAAPVADAEVPAEEAPADHAAPAGNAVADHGVTLGTYCVESNASITEGGEVVMNAALAEAGGGGHTAPAGEEGAVVVPQGSFAAQMAADCLPSGDVVPMEISGDGGVIPLVGADGVTATEEQLLERLAARRTELQEYEQDLALRASIVDAAEKRIEERTATLEALEAQISALVDEREQLETGQFAGIVAMYETMKPKDAAKIFNNLDMEVLLRVAKTMSPRKMAPILAEMDATRAQELTVQMAALADRPAAEMTPEDLAALPQIVGQ
ncbi:MotE family protein [Devosia sp.]|uniref:MotE family protein n=1 Tax=Devosia sp. TaxID=1871048 RepID=UPI001A070CF5|nr:MotE family protein [Devosia sp.]MBE0578398.1 MotE family protein [Devosia sp.]